MLVDDNKIDLIINKKIIEKYNKNIRIVPFNNSLTALEYLKISLHENNFNYFTRPNVLFLDINMPKCTGFEFLERLSRHGFLETQNFKIFMLSSSASLVDAKKANTHPLCSGYINKPLTIKKLHKVINNHHSYSNKQDVICGNSSA